MIPNYFCRKSFHWKQLQLKQSWWHQHEQIYPRILHLVVMVKQALPIRVNNQIHAIWEFPTALFTEKEGCGFSVQNPDYIPSSSSIIGWYGVLGSLIFSRSGLFDSMSFKFSSSHLTQHLKHVDYRILLGKHYIEQELRLHQPCLLGFFSFHCVLTNRTTDSRKQTENLQ